MLAAAVVLAVPVTAQTPDVEWRTVSTERFRVHYPAPAEAWALRAAERLEGVRDRVVDAVGWQPEGVVDVLVMDPLAQPNGMAVPLLGAPRMVLWTTPPGPESSIGHYGDWQELLMLHEDVHLVHLLRPSRNPFRRTVERTLLPVGPISLGAPRWVIEGYATMLEGELTGAGRPFGTLRAAVVREWARDGRLPPYGRLAADQESWMGMGMAYLVGSAFLEWLVEREGPESLDHLWRRMTARSRRSFPEAFSGVFGESPRRLYERFTAETAWRAVEVERALAPVTREGEVWQRLTWTTGEPAVAPDGERVAAVVRHRQRPPRLVVWGTAPDEAAEERRQQRRERLLERDPEDVPPVQRHPADRKSLHELSFATGGGPASARWLPDGESLLLVRFQPAGNGMTVPDLYRWWPAGGRVERLTRGAGLREADPAPGGEWAVAVRHRWGMSQLVRVDLADGTLAELTPPSLDEIPSWPRISPDGSRVALVVHRDRAWHLVVRDLAGGGELVLPVPTEAQPMQPAWSADGTEILASVAADGLVSILAFPSDGGEPRLVVRSARPALAPAPAPDGSIFYLGMSPDGLDLRLLPASDEPKDAGALPDLPRELAPAIPPAPAPQPPATSLMAPSSPRTYGLGRQEPVVLFSGGRSAAGGALEAGLRSGDVLGRTSLVALGSWSDSGGATGAVAAAAWRGWPVGLEAHLFWVEEEPSRQARLVPDPIRLDAVWQGGQVRLVRQGEDPGGRWRLAGGVFSGAVTPAGEARLSRRSVFAEGELIRRQRFAAVRLQENLQVRLEEGRTDGEGWRRWQAKVGLQAGGSRAGLRLEWEGIGVDDAPTPFETVLVGGLPGSLLPEAVTAGRLESPALPLGVLAGRRAERWRVALAGGGLQPFYERVRARDEGGWGEWLAVAGLAWRLEADALGLARLPGVTLDLGAARVLDEPFRGSTTWWAAVRLRP